MVTKKKETAEELTFAQQLKQQATAAGHYTVNLVKQTVQYAIDHPEDVMLLIATIALVDMESSLDGIEDSIETSATVDVLNYMDETSA
ncbi:uncharacterized protein METZ01_LOCUS181167 [marine metagenome]|uniref:Uncharacterized protein n=1 Tax=marine metagenome TaxID=408172 RepID=A0A382CSM5_9ZZZZ